MASCQYLSTRGRTSHLMKFYNHFLGKKSPIPLIHVSKLCLVFKGHEHYSVHSQIQQLRGASISSGNWGEHGKGGQNGQGHDQGESFVKKRPACIMPL